MIYGFLFRSILTTCLVFVFAETEARGPGTDYSRTPVLFVHGYGMSTSTWDKMMAHLIRMGYPREYLYAVEIIPNTMTNVEAATKVLEPAAQSLLEKARAAARGVGLRDGGPGRLDIVSHSMGAVSSRWYAAKLHPKLVRIWISLGGANHGTNVLCDYHGEAAPEMCPAFAVDLAGNSVQTPLNGTAEVPLDETPYGLGADRPGIVSVPPDKVRRISYFTIRIEPDEWIKPERAAVLDGAGGVPVPIPPGLPVRETSPGNFLFQARVRHDSLPEHPDLIHFVAAVLAAPHDTE